jgi:O-antigen/teichoic acid export membrane protein
MSFSEMPLTSGRLLAKNTLWNLLGSAAPALIAIIAIPLLIRGIGIARFGILTIVWTVIGYFTLFDFGLGAALTRMVADRLAKKEDSEIPGLVWTSLAVMFVLSLLGSVLMIVLSPVLIHRVLRVPVALQHEGVWAFILLAACIPFMVIATGLRGVLEAQQLFVVVTAIRIPTNVLTLVGPLVVLPFSSRLVPVVAVLAAGRILTSVLYYRACVRSMPELAQGLVFEQRHLSCMFGFGGWMTVSNVISPMMVYIDRFLIGTLVSVAAVAYYATPFEVVSRMLTVPGAVAGVLFPAFTVSSVQDRSRMALLLLRGQKYVVFAMFPLILIAVTMANDGLQLWLGSDFAKNSTVILQWLAVGVFINSLSQLPWVLIQSVGRPDLTAKFHLVELCLYVPALYFLVKHYGVVGAAIGWTVRVSCDTAVLALTAERFLLPKDRFVARFLAFVGAVLLVTFLGTLPAMFYQRALFLASVLLMSLLASWFVLLRPEERRMLRAFPGAIVRSFQRSEAT